MKQVDVLSIVEDSLLAFNKFWWSATELVHVILCGKKNNQKHEPRDWIVRPRWFVGN